MNKKQHKPNKLAELLLRVSFRREDISYRLGDMEEAFQSIAESQGISSAQKWYWKQVILSLPHFFNISFFWGTIMFKNYFKIALRNISKNKVYSFINIFGLAIGLAAAIIIFRWTEDELSTNMFHKNIDNIHRVSAGFKNNRPFFGAPPMVGLQLKEDYEEITNSARLRAGADWAYFSNGSDITFQEKFQAGDYSLFDIFTFPVKSGVINKESKDIYQVVISEKMAEKYFGKEDAVGKTLIMNDKYNLKVTAVIENPPKNSSIKLHILMPLEFLETFLNIPGKTKVWHDCSYATFVTLNKGTTKDTFAKKIKNYIQNYEQSSNYKLHVSLFAEDYLISFGQIEKIRLFQIIGILILLVACINFMNLSTARSAKRAREVGLRKVVGAVRKQLIFQFLGESFLITLISFVLSILLVIFSVPFFNDIANKQYLISDFLNQNILLGILAITFLTGLLAGSYPALYLSSFIPGKVLKGEISNSSKNKSFRTILVIAQFTITVVLIISSTTIYRQLDFMKNKNLGLSKEQILYFRLNGQVKNSVIPLKNELLKNSSIKSITASSHLPTGVYWNTHGFDWEGKDPELKPLVTLMFTDEDYLKTMEINLEEGKFFSGRTSDTNYVVINRTFAKILDWNSFEGRSLNWDGDLVKIKGVVSDFHFHPLSEKISPLVMFTSKRGNSKNYLLVKVNSDNLENTINTIESTVLNFAPKFPFNYSFLDERFDSLYRNETKYKELIHIFTLFAILISCLGLFGLAAFMAEQRTKEIGIRKVMGASVNNIMLILSKEFTKWILIANVIAIPIGYYYASDWLNDFAYKIDIGWLTFLLSALIALAVALLTVSMQTYKAATSNPIDSLRNE
ncbi:MAG: ABC transporter permease [Rhodothermaceae bacterium]